jgi:hypothetical protein
LWWCCLCCTRSCCRSMSINWLSSWLMLFTIRIVNEIVFLLKTNHIIIIYIVVELPLLIVVLLLMVIVVYHPVVLVFAVHNMDSM